MIRPPGIAVEYVDQVDEHQAGAAGYVQLMRFAQNNCHGGDDNECCQQSCHAYQILQRCVAEDGMSSLLGR